MPAASKTICGICKLGITKSQACIECNVCTKWIHGSCAKLTDSELSVLKSIKASAFICSVCEPGLNRRSSSNASPDIRDLNAKLDGFIQSYKDELGSLKSVLEVLREDVKSCMAEIQNDIVKCNDRISNVEALTTSKLSALEAENNALHRRLNRADFLISGLPQGLGDLNPVVVALGVALNVVLTVKPAISVEGR